MPAFFLFAKRILACAQHLLTQDCAARNSITRTSSSLIKTAGICSIIALVSGCSETPEVETLPLVTLQAKAKQALDDRKYEKAADLYQTIEHEYPCDRATPKAQLLGAYCAFMAKQYPRASATTEVFLALHPQSADAPYAAYLRARSYYDDMLSVQRDRDNTQRAIQAFAHLMTQYPNSRYEKSAQFYTALAKEHLASHDMCTTRHYMKEQNFVGALVILADMMHQWPTSVLAPEIWYRTLECQVALGMTEAAKRTWSHMTTLFGQTSWVKKGASVLEKFQRQGPWTP